MCNMCNVSSLQQILKRIEAARANPEVKKEALMKDYAQQMQYATQVSKTPGGPRPQSAKRAGKPSAKETTYCYVQAHYTISFWFPHKLYTWI